MLSWLRPPLAFVLIFGAVGAKIEEAREFVKANVGMADSAPEDGGEVINETPRRLLTKFAAMGAWQSPAIFP